MEIEWSGGWGALTEEGVRVLKIPHIRSVVLEDILRELSRRDPSVNPAKSRVEIGSSEWKVCEGTFRVGRIEGSSCIWKFNFKVTGEQEYEGDALVELNCYTDYEPRYAKPEARTWCEVKSARIRVRRA